MQADSACCEVTRLSTSTPVSKSPSSAFKSVHTLRPTKKTGSQIGLRLRVDGSLVRMLNERDDSDEGWAERSCIPNRISPCELEERLERWMHYYCTARMVAATICALRRLPEDLGRARTYVLHVYVHPCVDHGGAAAKYLHVLDASVIEAARAVNFSAPWPGVLRTQRERRDEDERMGRGAVARCMIDCGPLGMHVLPFASLKDLEHCVGAEWTEGLIEYVEIGGRLTGMREVEGL